MAGLDKSAGAPPPVTGVMSQPNPSEVRQHGGEKQDDGQALRAAGAVLPEPSQAGPSATPRTPRVVVPNGFTFDTAKANNGDGKNLQPSLRIWLTDVERGRGQVGQPPVGGPEVGEHGQRGASSSDGEDSGVEDSGSEDSGGEDPDGEDSSDEKGADPQAEAPRKNFVWKMKFKMKDGSFTTHLECLERVLPGFEGKGQRKELRLRVQAEIRKCGGDEKLVERLTPRALNRGLKKLNVAVGMKRKADSDDTTSADANARRNRPRPVKQPEAGCDGVAGGNGAGAGQVASNGTAVAGHMLLSCGMRDDVLRGSAAAIALLDPDYLGSLAGVKDRAEAAAKASCEAYESARANTEAATLQVEERRTQLMAVLQGVMEFASQLQLELTKGAAASMDLTSTKSSRQAWEAAEVVLAAAEAERASAGAEAQAAKQRAEQDRAASTVAAARERDVVDSAGRLVARLGGGESVSQLPDLVHWAVDFMRALSPDQQLEAALKTAAEGYPLSEHALRLLERLNRLQEEAFRGSRLAFRLSTQVTQFVLRVQTADRCAPRAQTAAE